MKHVLALLLLSLSVHARAWGPGDSGGGEPPTSDSFAGLAQGSPTQCLPPGSFWDELLPSLACGYAKPNPPTPVAPPPLPAVPEPGTWALWLAGLVIAIRRSHHHRKGPRP